MFALQQLFSKKLLNDKNLKFTENDALKNFLFFKKPI